jgi:hypothetical protein
MLRPLDSCSFWLFDSFVDAALPYVRRRPSRRKPSPIPECTGIEDGKVEFRAFDVVVAEDFW